MIHKALQKVINKFCRELLRSTDLKRLGSGIAGSLLPLKIPGTAFFRPDAAG